VVVSVLAHIIKIVVLATSANAGEKRKGGKVRGLERGEEERKKERKRNITTYHFWLLAAAFSLAIWLLGSTVPRKMGLNWFMPALAKRRVGSS